MKKLIILGASGNIAKRVIVGALNDAFHSWFYCLSSIHIYPNQNT